MKHLLFTLIAISTTFAFGQELPKVSQITTVNQTVGLNEISITYSRPNVNGRVIFGDLVPYNEVWRLGANECTKFTCSNDIMIGGITLPAGTYGIFAIPTKNQWEIVFNSDSEQWGSYDFDPAKNVLTYIAATTQATHAESMSIGFENLQESSGTIVIRWDDTSVSIPLTTNTTEAVKKEIQTVVDKGEDLAKIYYNAADYFVDVDELDAANSHLDKSLEIERAYYNVFMKATLIAEDDPKAAKKLANEAIKLAEKAEKEGWANHIKKRSADWK